MKLSTLRGIGVLTGVGVLLQLGACGSAPQPTDRLVSAKAAMRAAKEVGAAKNPQAQLHVQLAQEELDRAQKLLEDGENEAADGMLRRATADAELAVAVAREGHSKEEATQAEGGGAK